MQPETKDKSEPFTFDKRISNINNSQRISGNVPSQGILDEIDMLKFPSKFAEVNISVDISKKNVSSARESKIDSNSQLNISIFRNENFQILDREWKSKDITKIVPKLKANPLNYLGNSQQIVFQGTLLRYNPVKMKTPVWSKLYSERFYVLTPSDIRTFKNKEAMLTGQKPMFVIKMMAVLEVDKFELQNTNRTNSNYSHFYVKIEEDEEQGYYEKSLVLKNNGRTEHYCILASKDEEMVNKWCFLIDYFGKRD